jgi:hypothetical protein
VEEYLPAGQSLQVLEDVAASRVEYLPAGQSAHAPLPTSSENLPATQGVQNAVEEAANLGWYLPGAQSMHVDAEVAPSSVEYFPMAHEVHEALLPVE